MRIVQRYILFELLVNAFFTFCVLTAMMSMLMFSVVALKSSSASLSVLALLEVVGLQVVNRLDILLPLTILVASIWTYGRIQSDGEVSAMRGAGIGLYHLLLPAFLLGAIGCALLAWVQDEVIPWTHYRALVVGKRYLAANIDELLMDESRNIHTTDFKCRWASNSVDDEGYVILHDVVVSERRSAGAPRITLARTARPILSPSTSELTLKLTGLVRGNEASTEETTVRINLRNLSSDHRPGRRTSNLSYEELVTRSRRQSDTKKGREAIAEFLKRSGGALAAFLFALLGAPLGLVLQSSNRPYIFLVGFLSVMVFHYAPTAIMVRFIRNDTVAPVAGLLIMAVPLLAASGWTLRRLFAR